MTRPLAWLTINLPSDAKRRPRLMESSRIGRAPFDSYIDEVEGVPAPPSI
jgi:hypothetical protein